MSNLNTDEALTHLTTLGDWARWAASCFGEASLYFGHGTDNAWDEAVFLVLTVLHLPPEVNPLLFHATIIPSERQAIANLVQARVETRKPLAYLLKQTWFNGLCFYVDERVLVPRSPFAEWLDKQFIPWVEPENVTQILEIGVGSGCIAIGAAFAFPQAQVDAVDISDDALAVAAINVEQHGLRDRVHLLKSDCFDQLPRKCYDIILSNPPYVSEEEWVSLPEEYHREPRLALCAEDSGMAVVKKIFKQARDYLTPQGILVIEVGSSDQILVEHFPELPGIWLALEKGGQGLLLLTAEQLKQICHKEE
jgi:ribosomal protein L3 glutamine methyltransferase